MREPSLNVLVVLFCYGGNGGVATILPEIAIWLANLNKTLLDDPRVDRVGVIKAGDVPLTMERNKVVKRAKDDGFDVVLMIDSDNVPDLYLDHRDSAKPFWDTSFDLLYKRKLLGIPTVVCAPYCGPPPHPTRGGEENVYVFYATACEGDDTSPSSITDGCGMRFEAYSREHAALMTGIVPIAAGPTGCILYSTDAFDLMPVGKYTDDQIFDLLESGKITRERAKQLLTMESWFFYEYTDRYQTQKASTEDVTNTREIQFAGIQKFGQPVVFCNWDAWAGHYKPKCVGAPTPLRIENVSTIFAEAVRDNVSVGDTVIDVSSIVKPVSKEELNTEAINSGEPPYKKEMRLGKVFANPIYSEGFLESLTDLLSDFDRIVIDSDPTGELFHAVSTTKIKSAYVLDGCLDKCPHKYPMICKPLNRGFDWVPESDPEELDAVVLSRVSENKFAHSWFRHLREGGLLILLTDEPSVVDPVIEAIREGNPAFDTWICDNGIVAVQKFHKESDANRSE